MASLYISEYTINGIEIPGGFLNVPIPKEPSVTTQKVTFSTATQAAAFNTATKIVRLRADAACHVSFGTNPTATDAHHPMSADTDYEFAVSEGHTVSVYDGSS